MSEFQYSEDLNNPSRIHFFKKSKYYHWLYPLATYTKLNPRDSSKHMPIFILVRPKDQKKKAEKKKKELLSGNRNSVDSQPQIYSSMKIKASPNKVGQILLMCDSWVVRLFHSLINWKHPNNQ